MPWAVSAPARNGLSVGCCGSVARPECSPVTSWVASKLGRPCAVAQATLSAIWLVISAWDIHRAVPTAVSLVGTSSGSMYGPVSAVVAQRQVGPTTVGATWMQPRNCLLYTSDAADDLLCVDLGGRRI